MEKERTALRNRFFSQAWIEEALHYASDVHALTRFYCSQVQDLVPCSCMVVVRLQKNGIFSEATVVDSYPEGSHFPASSEQLLQLTLYAYQLSAYSGSLSEKPIELNMVLTSRLQERLSILPLHFEGQCFAAVLMLDTSETHLLGEFGKELVSMQKLLNPLLKNGLELYQVKEQLKAQNRVSQSNQERLVRLSDLVPVGIFRSNPTGAYTYVNKTWCGLAQCTAKSALGLGWLGSIHPEDLARVKETWFEAVRSKKSFTIEYRFLTKKSATVWILSEATPELDSEGSILEYIGTAVDISSRKDYEDYIQGLNEKLEARVAERSAQLLKVQQELIIKEKIASLNPMVAAISHELNTPLGIITTLSGAMNTRLSTFRAKMEQQLSKRDLDEFVDYIDETFKYLGTSTEIAITLIRSFKNISVDRAAAQRKTFDLVQLVKDLVLVLGPDLKDQSYKISYELPQSLIMDSYPGQLNQILDNLARNIFLHAFNCSDEGTVTVKAQLDSELQNVVKIDICDDGCGIEADNLSKIFDPFYTTKLGKGGSGLGLSIVYNLVNDVLGGSISVESWSPVDTQDRHGTQFTLRIPQNRYP